MVNNIHFQTATESAEAGQTVSSAATLAAEKAPEALPAADTAPEALAAAETAQNTEAAQAPEKPAVQVLLPLHEMSPAERFRATTKLIFLAPDVPPVHPRQRRNDMRQLDDLLDREFRSRGRGRDGRDSRDSRDARDGRDSRNTHDFFDDDREPSTNQRRSRRRSSDSYGDDDAGRSQAELITEPQRIKGSTRLEAKKQRRRDGRDVGRRRRMVVTESEFLARRESVDRKMIVRTTDDRIQIGVLEDNILVEHYVARSSESSLIGNVYIGRVQNVLPSMEAAFVDIGRGRNAVLYSGEVDWSEFEGTSSQRRIENALKPGDQVLVQVTKDPVGQKGARLTSQISLPGRFLVYVPGGAMNGISRKLPDTERARLKKILKEVLPEGASVIVRTAAEGVSEDQIKGDVLRLSREWEQIQAHTSHNSGPQLLHSEPDLLIKIIRDVFNEDFQQMIIQGTNTFSTIEGYVSQVAPELLDRISLHESGEDIFDEFRVNEQIIKALDRKVYLPSGGSLVIDRTEAMTVVDVNTGKFVGSGGNLEETVTKNNLEAAEEIVRQLRLRDIGGIIVIDFIDMVLESNRDLVLRRLVECLARDRTKHQVAEVTSLGLVQMTRKKLGLGLLESFSDQCEVCAGRGIIVQHEPVHRHHSDAPAKSKRRGANSSSNQVQQANAITEKSRSALAKIAASTIASDSTSDSGSNSGSNSGSDSNNASVNASSNASAKASTSDADAPATPPKRRVRPAKATALTETPATEATALPATTTATTSNDDLLGSVLDALPEAPQAGTRRRGSRRVSVAAPNEDSAI